VVEKRLRTTCIEHELLHEIEIGTIINNYALKQNFVNAILSSRFAALDNQP